MSQNTANPVTICPNKAGELITPYAKTPEQGFMQVQSVQISIIDGWIRESKRTALVRGKIAMLNMFLKHTAKGVNLPGRIQICEFVESQIPESYRKGFNKNLTEEEQIAPHLKRAGKDGQVLTCNGERIVRFSNYDESGTSVDIRVSHDGLPPSNGAEPSAPAPEPTPSPDGGMTPDQAADAIISGAGDEDAPF